MLPQSILKQIVKKRPYVIQSIKTHMKQDKKKKKKNKSSQDWVLELGYQVVYY